MMQDMIDAIAFANWFGKRIRFGKGRKYWRAIRLAWREDDIQAVGTEVQRSPRWDMDDVPDEEPPRDIIWYGLVLVRTDVTKAHRLRLSFTHKQIRLKRCAKNKDEYEIDTDQGPKVFRVFDS
jgi:hypothetical protein